jgi:ribonuclease BN (tRNA processing enzyme)
MRRTRAPTPAAANNKQQKQVLNVDNATASPSVLLFFDQGERYLFNAGEGLQRHMREYKVRYSKVEQMMFTRVALDTMAGLPGRCFARSVDRGGGGDDDGCGGVRQRRWRRHRRFAHERSQQLGRHTRTFKTNHPPTPQKTHKKQA